MKQKKSNSDTIDLIVVHELSGVTPEMIDWWWDHIDNSERYRLWHPKDHKSFEWEVSPGIVDGHVGAIHRVVEIIDGRPTTLRIRWEKPDSIPIKAVFEHKNAASVLDNKDKPISWILHEYRSIPNGTLLRSTFRLPAQIPNSFIEDLKKHNIEEIGHFTEFLPKLFNEQG
ncbi:MAG: DAPG hydrolase family protein [Candidatus Hermodarchaeota archaeon]